MIGIDTKNVRDRLGGDFVGAMTGAGLGGDLSLASDPPSAALEVDSDRYRCLREDLDDHDREKSGGQPGQDGTDLDDGLDATDGIDGVHRDVIGGGR